MFTAPQHVWEGKNIGVMSRMTLAEHWSRRRARNAMHLCMWVCLSACMCVCVCVHGGMGVEGGCYGWVSFLCFSLVKLRMCVFYCVWVLCVLYILYFSPAQFGLNHFAFFYLYYFNISKWLLEISFRWEPISFSFKWCSKHPRSLQVKLHICKIQIRGQFCAASAAPHPTSPPAFFAPFHL